MTEYRRLYRVIRHNPGEIDLAGIKTAAYVLNCLAALMREDREDDLESRLERIEEVLKYGCQQAA